MDAGEFYAQIDKADDELVELSYAFDDLMRKTEEFSARLEELATDAVEIKNEDKRERIESVLSLLRERLSEISEQCYNFSGELDEAHHCDFGDILIDAEEMAKEEEEKAV